MVHVCREWRAVVFGSPRRLNLRLRWTNRILVKEMLGVWPLLLPIAVRSDLEFSSANNVIAALEHNDRICELGLFDISSRQLEMVLTAIHRPFPALTCLQLACLDLRVEDEINETALIDPASFLGGSASCLQKLLLNCIPFPGLPTLLLSATHLVHLDLWGIPYSGFIPPDVMVTSLSVLTRLETLVIMFDSPDSPRNYPDWKSRHPPSQTRTLLPVLTKFQFHGVDEYLEYLVARIDVPQLSDLEITFYPQLVFNTPQLIHFISRTPKLKKQDKIRIFLSVSRIKIRVPQTLDGNLKMGIESSGMPSDWHLFLSGGGLQLVIPSDFHSSGGTALHS